MNTTMTGKDLLDQLAAGLTASLSGAMERVFGPGANSPVFDSFTWTDLGAMICIVLFVLLVNGLVLAFLRLKTRQTTGQESKELHHHVFRAVGKPLYLLIWIYGIYLAATPLLVKLPDQEGLRLVRGFFDKLFDLGVFAVVFWLFFRFTHVIESRLQLWAAKSESKLDDLLVPLLGKSLRVVVPLIAVILALPLLGLPPESSGILTKGSSLMIIGAAAWLLVQGVSTAEKVVLSKYDLAAADNLQARKVYTQVHVITKTLYVVIGIFTVASALMLFEEVRRFGTSILASAGVVGIIVGFAAQRTIANLFAGFQLAMTQPIRIDDVVIVEGEWGRIEEIALTYIVVHIWDDRRLIVPLSYFIEKPFQNWTRVSAELLGSVFVWADYSLPVTEVRREVKRVVESCADWDRRFWNLQVTDATDRAVQLRVLATAADASKAWDLRCEIREKLLAFMQAKYPQSLPKVRGDLETARDLGLTLQPR